MSLMITFRELSMNGKLSPVVAEEPTARSRTGRKRFVAKPPYVCSTYAPIEQTCPPTCLFFQPPPGGAQRPCYADSGFTKFSVRKLEEAAEGHSAVAIARQEALEIDRSFRSGPVPQDGARGGRDLRLHVSGDARFARAAEHLGAAATRWKARGGGSVWTYTHAWRQVERSSWGPDVSVLASVEDPADVARARAQGYASSIVVDAFPTERAYDFNGVKVLPCVAETHETTCAECRLCLDRDLLKLGVTIGFSAHGSGSAAIRRRLPVLLKTPIEQLCERNV